MLLIAGHNTVKHRYSEQALNEFRLVVKVSLIFSLVLKEIIKTYYIVFGQIMFIMNQIVIP